MTLSDFLEQLTTKPSSIHFADTMTIISKYYYYQPTEFTNGTIINAAGINEGSCKLFAFAQLNRLNIAQTLQLFGDYYRIDVLNDGEGTDHQNIRQFMQSGWAGIHFNGVVLTAK